MSPCELNALLPTILGHCESVRRRRGASMADDDEHGRVRDALCHCKSRPSIPSPALLPSEKLERGGVRDVCSDRRH